MKILHVICEKYNINKVMDLNRISELGCNMKSNTIYIRTDDNKSINIQCKKEDSAEAICTQVLDQYLDKTATMDSFCINIDDIIHKLHATA